MTAEAKPNKPVRRPFALLRWLVPTVLGIILGAVLAAVFLPPAGSYELLPAGDRSIWRLNTANGDLELCVATPEAASVADAVGDEERLAGTCTPMPEPLGLGSRL